MSFNFIRRIRLRSFYLISLLSVTIPMCLSVINRDLLFNEINITEAPFTLSLQFKKNHICGATIINTYWAISAAHCLTLNEDFIYTDISVCVSYIPEYIHSLKVPLTMYRIRSGSEHWRRGGKIHWLHKFLIHPFYDDTTANYDAALINVFPPFTFGASTMPIILPIARDYNRNHGYFVGWGVRDVNNGDKLSENLRKVFLPSVDWNNCLNIYKGLFNILTTQLCYGYQDGNEDTCKGDSGGALFNKNGIFIGISSWGYSCGYPKSPGVYTDVLFLKKWIQQSTKQ